MQNIVKSLPYQIFMYGFIEIEKKLLLVFNSYLKKGHNRLILNIAYFLSCQYSIFLCEKWYSKNLNIFSSS